MKSKPKRGGKGPVVNILIGGAPAGGPPAPRGPVGLGAIPAPGARPMPVPPPGAVPARPVPAGPGPAMKRGGAVKAGAGSGLGRMRKNGCR